MRASQESRKPKIETKEDVIRNFWAVFLNEKIVDDEVPGFRQTWDKFNDWARRECDHYCASAWNKIQRDHREPNECISASVAALRVRLREEPPEPTKLPTKESIDGFLATLISALAASPIRQVFTRPVASLPPADETYFGRKFPEPRDRQAPD